jgi:hypothetical protein
MMVPAPWSVVVGGAPASSMKSRWRGGARGGAGGVGGRR